MKSPALRPALVVAMIAFTAPVALAQTTSRTADWQPWFGCWQSDAVAADEMLCIVEDGGAVRMVTLVDGAVRADTRIIADGQVRRTNRDGCMNEESARWSRDHRRVFLASEVTCPAGITRNVRGMLAFVGPDEWMSVQTVTSNDGTATRAVRFAPVQGLRIPGTIAGALRSSTMTRASFSDWHQVDEADVLEASTHVDAGAIDEWLTVLDAPYRLAEGGSSVSALDQIGRLSHEVRYADGGVVRIVERPVYVIRSYGRRTYSSCWTPWGYDHFGWRASRPYVRIYRPIVINVGSRGGHYDRGRYDRDRYDRDRYDRDRSHREWNDRGNYERSGDARVTREGYSRDGRATRDGYTRSRETRAQPPARSTVGRSTARSSQPRQAPAVKSSSSTRTAKPRSSSRP